MTTVQPSARQVGLVGTLHIIVSFGLYAVASALALGAFERNPSPLEDALVVVGTGAGFPLIYVLAPALGIFLPKALAAFIAAVANSAFWGFVLALAINWFRSRGRAA